MPGGYTLLGFLAGADFNTTSDQPITLSWAPCVIRRIMVRNSSAGLTTALGGLYTGASKSGTVLVAATQAYTNLSVGSKYMDLTLAGIVATDTVASPNVFFALTLAQGVPATADIYIYGEPL